jgi:hypothetical protein
MANGLLERRVHKRLGLSCPIMLSGEHEAQPLKSKTINVSNGGVFLAVPVHQVPSHGASVSLRLLVPRSTPNTYMLEEFQSQAKVLRHEMLKDNTQVGVALVFDRKIDLGLES